ncbi:glucosaminidase domain-containing protein [Marinomonas posidonica]|uniref:Lysozyme subfamily 2 n=1 Tax=Marinomonas posidonica (strain CECT 7376 / NCIMB 14433 / IVIA-Po-181) TaxID=491952 RepID=F6CRQ2_MARPP|nr:glucosaminidase domain-containing protein [Marinomonas posidonica]AEF53815.1 Lysozyme subfamily 2 [Marinomonas posidonica IVIA-Po-181]
MEKKILWVITIILILVLWIKTGPFQDEEDVTDADTTEKVSSAGEATQDEKDYFKSHPIQTKAPDFQAITDVKARKKAFFEYLSPFAKEKNDLILADRERLNTILKKSNTLSNKEIAWISKLRKDNKLKVRDQYSTQELQTLLTRLDIIPTSLVLAQAANESAWGTSRFATQGNNYFGQWCFRKGCGLVPVSRDNDADHEVRKFHDARESVFAYIDNLNTNSAYKKLRNTRANLRQQDEVITGLALAQGLEHYSQRGHAYVKEIIGLINYNKLWRFNRIQANNE